MPEQPGVPAPRPSAQDALLDSSPFSDTVEEALAANPPRARLPLLTLCLGAGVVAVAGFLGGIQADRQWGSVTPAADQAARSDRPSGFPAPGGRFPGGGQFPGGGRSGTTGTVEKVTGDVITVKTADGRTVEVQITDETRITVERETAPKALKPGAQVTIRSGRPPG